MATKYLTRYFSCENCDHRATGHILTPNYKFWECLRCGDMVPNRFFEVSA